MNVPKAKTKPGVSSFALYSLVAMAVCFASLLCMLVMLGRVVVIPEQHQQYIPEPHQQYNFLKFEDIVIDSLKGAGSVIVAYKVKIPKIDDKDYIMKVTWERYLEYSAVETKTFRLLNEPPTSPSIPPLIFNIPSMTNPWSKSDLPTLGLDETEAKFLLTSKNIGIQVYPLVPHSDFPDSKNLPELARFMSSLLTALDFAHRRNVMNCDIHSTNLAYYEGTTYMFDWNAAQIFAPNQVKLHQEDENKRILPPETVNKDSLHVTVSAADVWATGRVLNKLLCDSKVCTMPKRHRHNKKLRAGHALAAWMMTKDPHARPSAAELLKHDFFKL